MIESGKAICPLAGSFSLRVPRQDSNPISPRQRGLTTTNVNEQASRTFAAISRALDCLRAAVCDTVAQILMEASTS
jgi:hypothetical protein